MNASGYLHDTTLVIGTIACLRVCVCNVHVARAQTCVPCVHISTVVRDYKHVSEVLPCCRCNDFTSRNRTVIDAPYPDEESTQLHPFALSSSPVVVATDVAPSSVRFGACQCCGCQELSPTFPHSTGFQVATCDIHDNKRQV